jgi:hypothetical protein
MMCGSVSLGSLSLRLSEGLSLFNDLGGEVMIMSRYRFTHLGDSVPIPCKAFIVVVMKENMEKVIERFLEWEGGVVYELFTNVGSFLGAGSK